MKKNFYSKSKLIVLLFMVTLILCAVGCSNKTSEQNSGKQSKMELNDEEQTEKESEKESEKEETNNVEVVSKKSETNSGEKEENEHSLEYYKEVFYNYVYSNNNPCVSNIKEHYLYKNTDTDSGKAFKEAVDKILEKGFFIQMAEGYYDINETEREYSDGELQGPDVYNIENLNNGDILSGDIIIDNIEYTSGIDNVSFDLIGGTLIFGSISYDYENYYGYILTVDNPYMFNSEITVNFTENYTFNYKPEVLFIRNEDFISHEYKQAIKQGRKLEGKISIKDICFSEGNDFNRYESCDLVDFLDVSLIGDPIEKEEFNEAYEDFFNIKECIIRNGLNIKENPDNETCLFAEGEFDLNKDGNKDEITLELKFENESIIKINNSEIKNFFEYPNAAYLVDLIKDDEYIEIAIIDQGASADPYTAFYRYNGETIQQISGGFYTEITSEDSVNIYCGQVLTNGKGMFISPIDAVQFVSPKIIKGYRTLEDSKFIYHPVNYDDALNNEYTISSNFDAYLNKQNKNSNSSVQGDIFNSDVYGEKFHKGQKIKINTISNPMNEFSWYEVELKNGTKVSLDPFVKYGIELQDGTTGELYFWIGD